MINDFFKTRELERFIRFLNCYAGQKWQDNFMATTQKHYINIVLKNCNDYIEIYLRPKQCN